jgi:hypothetical protein
VVPNKKLHAVNKAGAGVHRSFHAQEFPMKLASALKLPRGGGRGLFVVRSGEHDRGDVGQGDANRLGGL